MVETEILIIGGGIAGASAAYHLGRGGREVVLLERGAIASEASGVNAGSIGGMGWGRVPDLQAYLTMGSQKIFRDLQLELGHDIEFRCSGALQAIHLQSLRFKETAHFAVPAFGQFEFDEAVRVVRAQQPDLGGSQFFAVM